VEQVKQDERHGAVRGRGREVRGISVGEQRGVYVF